MLCPKPANEPEPEDELFELELDPPPPPPELEDDPVELEELEDVEELEELEELELEELGELEELLEGVDELLEAPELLPVDEPVLDPPGPVGSASPPHPGSGATPASTAPPERRRRKSRRSSRDNCLAGRRTFAMILRLCQSGIVAATILVINVTRASGPGCRDTLSKAQRVAGDRGQGR